MSGFATINGVNKTLGDGWVTINDVYRKIKGGWKTKNGIWQQILSSGLALSALPVGTLIKLNESGTGVNFYLAKHDYENGLNGAGRELLVRKDCYDQRRWHSKAVNAYASSEIDSWLNNTYKGVLDPEVQTMIGTTKFYYTPGNGNTTVGTLERGVFLLSMNELGKAYSNTPTEGSVLPIASTLQIAYLNGTAVNQWTRSPYKTNKTFACYVSYTGGQTGIDANYTSKMCSRPCFTLPATAMVNPTPNADGSYTLLA